MNNIYTYIYIYIYKQKNFHIRILIKQLWTKYRFLKKSPQFSLFTKIVFLKVLLEIFRLPPSEFGGCDMREILFSNFACCESLKTKQSKSSKVKQKLSKK